MQNEIIRKMWKPEQIMPEAIRGLLELHPELVIVDELEKNLEELFLLRHPCYRYNKDYQNEFEEFKYVYAKNGVTANVGVWFYFPWINTLVHFLEEDLHLELRTGRNRNLISEKEQRKFYGASVAVLGLSIGSHVATTIAMTGGAKYMRLADPDVISGDNLNRIRSGYANVGVEKVIAVARQIFEINPYADIRIYPEGATENNLKEILDGVTVIVEEMDNPFFKIKVREIAREKGIPVVMGTDNGDGVIIDVERYDRNRAYPILHGKIGSISAAEFRKIPPCDLPRIAAKIAGADIAVPQMLTSVAQVGKTLYSWPQLGTAATVCGAVVSYLVRRICAGDPHIRSGRRQVNLDAIFEHGYHLRWFSRKKSFYKFIQAMNKK